jgi:hypothetical protein
MITPHFKQKTTTSLKIIEVAIKRIGDEGDDPHWLPALAAGQGICFVDFPNPFRPAIAIKESGHFWTAK